MTGSCFSELSPASWVFSDLQRPAHWASGALRVDFGSLRAGGANCTDSKFPERTILSTWRPFTEETVKPR